MRRAQRRPGQRAPGWPPGGGVVPRKPPLTDADRERVEAVTPLSLLERARAKDPQAWHRLVQPYQPLVRYWCARAHVPAADGEDVCQEVFAAAAAGLGQFRHDRPGD